MNEYVEYKIAININKDDIIMLDNYPCKIIEIDIIKNDEYPKIYVLGIDVFTQMKYNYYFSITEKIIIPKINKKKCKILTYDNKKIWLEMSDGEIHEIFISKINNINNLCKNQLIELLEINGKQKIIFDHDIISII